MATVNVTSLRRPKKLVRYGKSASRSTYNTSHVDTLMEDELTSSAPTVARKTTLKDSYTVDKPTRKASSLKAVKPCTETQDTFDVPFSDDEITFLQNRPLPPRIKARATLVDDPKKHQTRLAPWEVTTVVTCGGKNASPITTRIKNHAQTSPDEQLRRELVKATKTSSEQTSPSNTTTRVAQSQPREVEPSSSSAATRLAARRRVGDGSVYSSADERARTPSQPSKRALTDGEDDATLIRKRMRKPIESADNGDDVVMADFYPAQVCKALKPKKIDQPNGSDLYDFPASDADDVVVPKSGSKKSPAVAKASPRGKLKSYSSRTTSNKDMTVRGRLFEMPLIDTDTTDTTSPRSPTTSASRPATPARVLTPVRSTASQTKASPSPDIATKPTGAITPKQAQLWKQLLPSGPTVPSPSALRMKELTISGASRNQGKASSLARNLIKSKFNARDHGGSRTRLVDRLKASAVSSGDESGSDEGDATTQDVEQVEVAKAALPLEGSVSGRTQTYGSQATQSTSQGTSNSDSGPKRTYANSRSYLPEDDLENGLVLDVPASKTLPLPLAGRGAAQKGTASQKSAFDLDDSDEDTGTGRLRTIHELRAAGRNHGFKQEVDGLLEDISSHSSTARARRRSALLELAANLAEKSYAERFVAQGLEYKLLNECAAASDDVTDFLLAAAMALLLAAEPHEHTIQTFKTEGALDWFAHRLRQGNSIVKVAKERSNNVSKSAQTCIRDFCGSLLNLPVLWADVRPEVMSSRIIALKGLDLLIGRLRRLGDKDQLLSENQLCTAVLHSGSDMLSDTCECTLLISMLESLSTTTLTLVWPMDVLLSLADCLVELQKRPALPTQMQFLALRLTLNLTNDNATNCDVFSGPGVIGYLLHSVQDGFGKLEAPADDSEQGTIDMDLLVLAMVIMTNIAEHSEHARTLCIQPAVQPMMSSLVNIFQKGQQRTLEANSVEEAAFNIPFGYLAVMLANICQSANAASFIASQLPGKNLDRLVAAVVEFITYHQTVDMMTLDGEEGMDVRSGFTERLKAVLERLRAAAGM